MESSVKLSLLVLTYPLPNLRLRNDTSLTIVPADKGCAPVVMDTEAYDTKVTNMLSDPSTYKPVAKDPTATLQRRMNALLLSLRCSNHLSDSIYLTRCTSGCIPLLYGLPKIHKPETPLRPIVSFLSSPTYQLSKHLSRILAPLVGNTSHNVQNSQDFAKFISSQTLDDDETLVSFDIVSVFTKVPTQLAIQVAHQCLLDDTSLTSRTPQTTDEITTILKFWLNATYFAFCNSLYQQVHGTAMGSPVSVVVADLVMEDVESRALATFPSPPRFRKRYVDDTCWAPRTDLVEDFHCHLNSIESSIQFTIETESDGQLAFLNVLISRNSDRSIGTTVYRKPTHANKYLDFSSHHPLAHKIAVVRTLSSRAQALMSSAVTRTQEEHTVSKALAQNGYPATFIHRHSHTLHNLNAPSQSPTVTTSTTIPYIKGTSEAIRQVLSPLGIRTTFRPTNTLRQLLVRPKDPVPQLERPGVVYHIPCTNCPQAYIGQTGRTLTQHLKEHRRAVTNGDLATSALAEHAHSTGHPTN